MKRIRTFATSLLALTSLLAVPAADSRAEISIRFHAGGAHHGHGGVHKRLHKGHGGLHGRGHGPRKRFHYFHAPPRHRFGSHHGAPRHHGFAGRQVFGAGCTPITRYIRDRHGRSVLRHETLCFDRHGQPFLPGHGHRHR